MTRTTCVTERFIINDVLGDGYLLLENSRHELYVADEDPYDHNIYMFRGTSTLPDYQSMSNEEVKAWACAQLGWTPDDCDLDMTVTITTTTTETLC